MNAFRIHLPYVLFLYLNTLHRELNFVGAFVGNMSYIKVKSYSAIYIYHEKFYLIFISALTYMPDNQALRVLLSAKLR